MTPRERFHATMSFQPADRVPNWELGVWGQTVERWEAEGMPRHTLYWSWFEGEPYFNFDRRGFIYLNVGMIPAFDAEVLEETERHVVMRHANGIVTRAMKIGTVSGTRPSMDQYLEFPVKNRTDFLKLKKRYDPSTPIRYPMWWDEHVETWRQRDYPLILLGNGALGLYSTLRTWMGTENLSLAFHDDPNLVHEMMDFVADFLIETTQRAVEAVDIDYFNFFEDFAYKTGPLISPELFRKFMMPRYQRIMRHFRKHGIQQFWIDSDGNTEVLIPLLIETGFTCHWPLEIAADMEPLELRGKFGKDLAFCGGIDKRPLAQGKEAIREEVLRKVPQLLEQGGYIPHVDHTVPHDISWENFVYYMELKQAVIEGRFGA